METLLLIVLIASNVLFAVTFTKYANLRNDVANFCARLKRTYDAFKQDGEAEFYIEALEEVRKEFCGEVEEPALKDTYDSIKRNYDSEYE